MAEVLSESTQSSDFGPTRTEYQRLADLASYLILDQERRRAWIWTRLASGSWPADPDVIEAGNVTIARLAIEIPIDEFYEGIPTT